MVVPAGSLSAQACKGPTTYLPTKQPIYMPPSGKRLEVRVHDGDELLPSVAPDDHFAPRGHVLRMCSQ
jgi:hypothetical protein